MADVLDKVQKLIALALNNPNGEEARSAALKAVQLMGEHGVLLRLPQDQAASSARNEADRIYRAQQDAFFRAQAEHMDGLRQRAQQRQAEWEAECAARTAALRQQAAATCDPPQSHRRTWKAWFE